MWRAPESPVSVAYQPGTLEEIRLAVLEAFYAFPRGGAEIGGVLFGAYAAGEVGGQVCIRAWRDLGCEHASGPSFTLSAGDDARLAALLQAPETDVELSGLVPVGWYHSHTRSDIFLSPQDVEIHERYFPEPWHVALVLRPSFAGTRAAFFARDESGVLRTEAGAAVFPLEPANGRALARALQPEPQPFIEPQDAQPELPAPPGEEPSSLPLLEPPAFLCAAAPPRRRLRLWALAAQLAVSGIAIYATRGYWLGLLPAVPESAVIAPAAATGEPVALHAIEQDGRLQIRWNSRAPAVVRASGGTLAIRDGGVHTVMAIEPERLLGGMASYVPQTAHVEIALELAQPGGRSVAVNAVYTGQPPGAAAPDSAESADELRRQRDELRKQLLEARTELVNQGLLIRKLQRATPSAAPRPSATAAPKSTR